MRQLLLATLAVDLRLGLWCSTQLWFGRVDLRPILVGLFPPFRGKVFQAIYEIGFVAVDGPKYCDIFGVADRIPTANTVYRFDYVTRSWLFRPSSPTRIFDWFADYGPKHYDIVGVADIISTTNTVYRWDDAAAAYQPQSPNFLRIFKRRS